MDDIEIKQEIDEDSDKRTTRESTKAARDSKVSEFTKKSTSFHKFLTKKNIYKSSTDSKKVVTPIYF